MKYLIWSIEHEMWWMPISKGYTKQLDDAGRYAYEDAKKIVTNANIVKEQVKECIVPEGCVVSHTCSV
jgi:hypothetical protein